MAAKPDAVLVAAAGGPTVLPHTTLIDAGYKGRIYQTHGAASPAFLTMGGAKVEGAVLAASLMLVLPEIADSTPSKKVAQDYVAAYEEMLGRTSTEAAPWYVVPADRKWFRNLAVSQVLVDTLESLGLRYPEPEEGLEGLKVV